MFLDGPRRVVWCTWIDLRGHQEAGKDLLGNSQKH